MIKWVACGPGVSYRATNAPAKILQVPDPNHPYKINRELIFNGETIGTFVTLKDAKEHAERLVNMRTVIKRQGNIYWVSIGQLVFKIDMYGTEEPQLAADLETNPEFARFLNGLEAVNGSVPVGIVERMFALLAAPYDRKAPGHFAGQFLVICRDKYGYHLATRTVFTDPMEAEAYAGTIAKSHLPIVVASYLPIVENIKQ